MEKAKRILAHSEAALDIADAEEDHLLGPHLCVSNELIAERLAGDGPPGHPPAPHE